MTNFKTPNPPPAVWTSYVYGPVSFCTLKEMEIPGVE